MDVDGCWKGDPSVESIDRRWRCLRWIHAMLLLSLLKESHHGSNTFSVLPSTLMNDR